MQSGFAKVGLAPGIAAVPSASRLCQTVPAAATTPAVQGRAPSEDRVHSGSYHLAQIFVGYSFGADTLPYIVQNLLCPALPDGLVDKVVLPGGHHFDGNADAVAATLLRGRPA